MCVCVCVQDVEVTGDTEDSRSLHITIHRPSLNPHARPLPLLAARFLFDDHIRCMAAKQRLTKGRLKARQRKMQMIARLLELPGHIVDSMYQPAAFRQPATAAVVRQPTASAGVGASAGFIPGGCHTQAEYQLSLWGLHLFHTLHILRYYPASVIAQKYLIPIVIL